MIGRIRFAALLLGMGLLLAFPGFSPGRLVLLWAPWIAALALTFVRPAWTREALALLGADEAFRWVAMPLLAAFLLVAHLLGTSGALIVLTWAFAGWLAAAVLLDPRTVRGATLGCAVALLTTLGLLTVTELVLRNMPAIAANDPRPAPSWYDRLWDSNVYGFRSPYESTAKAPGATRVLVLGDSFSWGQRIKESSDIWPGLLEARLRSALSDPAIEVWNYSRSGYTTANELEALRRLGWNFDPDLVIVQFYLNDPLPSRPDFGHEGSSWLFGEYWLLPEQFRDDPIADTQLYETAHRIYNGLRTRGVSYSSLYTEGSQTWRELNTAIEGLGAESRARGVPILFVLFPAFEPGEWTEATHPYTPEYRRVAAVASEHGLLTLDLTPAFASEGGDWARWWVSLRDAHPSRDAHKIAADAIGAFIETSDLLPLSEDEGSSVP